MEVARVIIAEVKADLEHIRVRKKGTKKIHIPIIMTMTKTTRAKPVVPIQNATIEEIGMMKTEIY
jgi:hypothetical protein